MYPKVVPVPGKQPGAADASLHSFAAPNLHIALRASGPEPAQPKRFSNL